MTPEQQAAFIYAQAVYAMGRIAGMQAENQHRNECGSSVAYGEEAFSAAVAGLGHNDIISFFQGS